MIMQNSIKRFLKKIGLRFVREKTIPVIIQTPFAKLLEGKTALVTGGSSGIGLAIAQSIVASGGKVIIAGRSEKRLKAVIKEMGEANVKSLVLDVSQPEEIHEKFNELVQHFSENEKIDILVNSAGVHGNQTFGTISQTDYDTIMNTNLRGLYFMCQEVANYMKANRLKGNILNISSASALKPAWSPYEISKWGVRGLTLGLARELIPYGIVVNGLAPGPTATAMLQFTPGQGVNWPTNPSGRVATPEEVGGLAVYMLSNAGRYIVGDTFFITGGSGTINIDK